MGCYTEGVSAPTTANPHDVPEVRTHLLEQWMPGRPFNALAVALEHDPKLPQHHDPGNYAMFERKALSNAQLWWVAEDMVGLTMAAMSRIPDEVKVTDLTLPANTGFAVFQSPWLGMDAHLNENKIEVSAVLWGLSNLPPIPRYPEGARCLSLSAYGIVDYDKGLTAPQLQLASMLGLPGSTSFRIPGDHQAYRVLGTAWVPLGRSDWPLDDSIITPPWPMEDARLRSFIEDRRFVSAMFSLLAQKNVVQTAIQRPPRHIVRRTTRKYPKAQTDVRVITVREPVVHGVRGPDAGHHYSVRFMVGAATGGFPRLQRYGPRNSLRKLIWIDPYTKGPADAPFRQPETVRAWRR